MATALTNGQSVAVTVSKSSGAQYAIVLPAGASNLVITLSGLTADLDLFAKFGSEATNSSSDTSSTAGGTDTETIKIPAPSAGTYYIYVYGYAAGSGVLTAAYAGREIPTDNITVSSPAAALMLVPACLVTLTSPAVLPPRYCRDTVARYRVPVGHAFTAAYRAPGVIRDVTGSHSIAGPISRTWTTEYAIPSSGRWEWLARYVVGAMARVSRDFVGRQAIPADGPSILWEIGRDPVVAATVAGQQLDLLTATISGDLDSFAWSAEIAVPDEAAWLACVPRERLSLTIGGVLFVLLIESRSRNLQAGSAEWSVSARTLSCLLDAPHAATVTQTWGTVTASAAARELAALAGLALSWEVVDWTLPAGRLTASGETPASILSRLAEACGAVVQPEPGGGLRVLYRYPVGVTAYAATLPDITLSDDVDVLKIAETFVAAAGYNAVVVTDDQSSTEAYLAMELDDDRNASRTTFPAGEPCYFRVYHAPKIAYKLRVTSGRLEQVATAEQKTLSETVSFDAVDTANLGKLVHAIGTVRWWGNNLGSMAPSGGVGVVLSGGAGFGVATVTYSTQYDVWRLIPDDLAEAFPVLLELTEAA